MGAGPRCVTLRRGAHRQGSRLDGIARSSGQEPHGRRICDFPRAERKSLFSPVSLNVKNHRVASPTSMTAVSTPGTDNGQLYRPRPTMRGMVQSEVTPTIVPKRKRGDASRPRVDSPAHARSAPADAGIGPLVIRPIARSIKRRRQVSPVLRTSGSLAHLKAVVRGTSFSHAHRITDTPCASEMESSG
jgi:hypothetical protein